MGEEFIMTTVSEKSNKVQSFASYSALIMNVAIQKEKADVFFKNIDHVYDEHNMSFIFESFEAAQGALGALDKNGFFPDESYEFVQEFAFECSVAHKVELCLV